MKRSMIIVIAAAVVFIAGLAAHFAVSYNAYASIDWQRAEATVTDRISEYNRLAQETSQIHIVFETNGIVYNTFFESSNSLVRVPENNRTEQTQDRLSIGAIGNTYYILYNPDNPYHVTLSVPTATAGIAIVIFFTVIFTIAIFVAWIMTRKRVR